MITQILGALGLLKELVTGIKELYGFYQQAKEDAWWKEWQETRKQLRDAKTTDERKEVAKKIRDIFGSF